LASSRVRRVVLSGLIGLVAAILAWAVSTSAAAVRTQAIETATAAGRIVIPVLLVVVVGSAVAVTWAVFHPAADRPVPDEEPLLHPPQMPPITRATPVVTVLGTEPGSGASTLAFNLAALAAASGAVHRAGQVHAARPLCVLSEGRLSAALGLSSGPFTGYAADHPGYIRADVLDLVVSHLAGVDILCIGGAELESAQLPRLFELVRRQYDLVVFDCPLGLDRIAATAAHEADAVLVSALPTPQSLAFASGWAVRFWDLGQERKTALVVNRISAQSKIDAELTAGFLYHGELPDDPAVGRMDDVSRPWVLRFDSTARESLDEIARALLPELLRAEARRAA
jgi:cellulose biosynthesis protein BcsQ